LCSSPAQENTFTAISEAENIMSIFDLCRFANLQNSGFLRQLPLLANRFLSANGKPYAKLLIRQAAGHRCGRHS
jgi:hypothetical protein